MKPIKTNYNFQKFEFYLKPKQTLILDYRRMLWALHELKTS